MAHESYKDMLLEEVLELLERMGLTVLPLYGSIRRALGKPGDTKAD